MAGSKPHNTPVETAVNSVKPSALPSIRTPPRRGMRNASRCARMRVPATARTSPSAAPHIESATLSVSVCRSSLWRPAPNAARTAISLCRAAIRASCRFERFAHTISITTPTAHASTSRAGRTRPLTCSSKGVSLGWIPLRSGCWRSIRFASSVNSASALCTVALGLSRPVMVVGVLPASFDFASIFAPGSPIDLFVPFPLTGQTNSQGNTTSVIGRLKPGATVHSADAEFTLLAKRIERQHPERNGIQPRLTPLELHVSGRVRRALLVLACAVGVVMLIVCANLSNLQLARMAARHKEMAVRAALGAGRHRLLRQTLTESVALSMCGAALGLVLAVAGTRILAHLDAFRIPLLGGVRIDGSALGFTLLTAVSTGVLCGLLPAIQAPAFAVRDALKDNSRGSRGSRRHAWIRSGLV